MKAPDWSVIMLGRERNSIGLCIHLNTTRIAKVTSLLHIVVVNKLASKQCTYLNWKFDHRN